jgi:hypothetical protein
MTPILQIPFLLFAHYTSPFLFKNSKLNEFWIYLFYGLIGLFIIEWVYVGNSPWANPNANQFIMFSYWGGSIIFARIISNKTESVQAIRKWTKRYFIIYSILAITLGFLIPQDQRLTLIVLMAIIGYGFMNVLYFLYFVKRFREPAN